MAATTKAPPEGATDHRKPVYRLLEANAAQVATVEDGRRARHEQRGADEAELAQLAESVRVAYVESARSGKPAHIDALIGRQEAIGRPGVRPRTVNAPGGGAQTIPGVAATGRFAEREAQEEGAKAALAQLADERRAILLEHREALLEDAAERRNDGELAIRELRHAAANLERCRTAVRAASELAAEGASEGERESLRQWPWSIPPRTAPELNPWPVLARSLAAFSQSAAVRPVQTHQHGVDADAINAKAAAPDLAGSVEAIEATRAANAARSAGVHAGVAAPDDNGA